MLFSSNHIKASQLPQHMVSLNLVDLWLWTWCPNFQREITLYLQIISLLLSLYLLNSPRKGVRLTGTVRQNRQEGCPLDVKKIEEMKRGSFENCYEKTTVSVMCTWNDNSVVTVLSSAHSVKPLTVARRYSQSEKKIIEVQQPNLLRQYNKNKGGVNRFDQNVSYYSISIRNKKWWFQMFVFGVHVGLQNAACPDE